MSNSVLVQKFSRPYPSVISPVSYHLISFSFLDLFEIQLNRWFEYANWTGSDIWTRCEQKREELFWFQLSPSTKAHSEKRLVCYSCIVLLTQNAIIGFPSKYVSMTVVDCSAVVTGYLKSIRKTYFSIKNKNHCFYYYWQGIESSIFEQ